MNQSDIENKLIQEAVKKSANRRSKVGAPFKILLTEGEDERVQAAAKKITEAKIGDVIVLADNKSSLDNCDICTITPSKSDRLSDFVNKYIQIRGSKAGSKEQVTTLLKTPLYFGAMMLKEGVVDVAVSGTINTTPDVFRAGIKCLGISEGIKSASSFFYMVMPDGRGVTFSDCGLIPYPSAEELTDIAITAAHSHKKITNQDPRVALLSFSTKGSANHERVDLVRNAFDLIKAKAPDLIIDGELQFDAAFVPEVATRKAPDSVIKGDANVFIFPNLDAGNIGYKIAERIGGARAIGPLLQGLAEPWMDLSRGCSADDIVLVAAVAVLLK